jgi:cytidyltransferase-like protein
MARLISSQGHLALVDFVNPTKRTRQAFGGYDYSVWVDRNPVREYKDTTDMFQSPTNADIVISEGMSVDEEAVMVLEKMGVSDWTQPTTLMLGRYQPWHEGHQALKEEAHKRTDQVLIGVRNTHGTSEKDPLSYEQVVEYIRRSDGQDHSLIMKLPNITNIVYGRDVGYKIEHIELSQELQNISATNKRKEMGI